MLKLVYYCLHNFFDDLSSFFVKKLKALFAPFRKRALLHEGPALALAGIAVVFISGSVAAAAHVFVTHNNNAVSAQQAPAVHRDSSEHADDKKVATNKNSKLPKHDKTNDDKTKKNASDKNAAASSNPTKTFNTAVTHNGQVKAGTLIAYDADKDTKTYYAGDFSFSVSTVVVHKSTSLNSASFTVSTPDSSNANFPALSPDEQNGSYTLITNDSTSPDNNWNLAIQISNTAPNGTYQVHLISSRTAQNTDAWEYDGFITLKVED